MEIHWERWLLTTCLHHEHRCSISCLCQSMLLIGWWWWNVTFCDLQSLYAQLVMICVNIWFRAPYTPGSVGAAGCRRARSFWSLLWHEGEVSVKCHGWVRILCVTGPSHYTAHCHHLPWRDGKWLFVLQMLSFFVGQIQCTNQQWQHFPLPSYQSNAHNSFLPPIIFSVVYLK